MRVILSGGMTGGHLYPALAFAEEVKLHEPDSDFLFVGQDHDYGDSVLSDRGFHFVKVPSRGFDRRNPLKNVPIARDMAITARRVKAAIDGFKPDVVFTTGGHVTTAVVKAASKQGVATFIHEQNVYPGLANKLASRYADRIFVSFQESESYFKYPDKIIVSGNPLRQVFTGISSDDCRASLSVAKDSFCILLFGGSRGAAKLCDVFARSLPDILKLGDVKVFMISGADYYESVVDKLDKLGVSGDKRIVLLPYTEDIHLLYGAADIVVSRAGALSVSEIALMGKPSILIPSPNVTHDHQTYNAKTLSDNGAAVLLPDAELSTERLLAELIAVRDDPGRLQVMSEAARSRALAGAASTIYNEVSSYIHAHRFA